MSLAKMIRFILSIVIVIILQSSITTGYDDDGYGQRGGYTGIELCQCPHMTAPINYVAVEVPRPVRVTTVPAPNLRNQIPIVLPEKKGGYD